MKRPLFPILAALFLGALCVNGLAAQTTLPTSELTVAAAANLAGLTDSLAAGFAKVQPAIKLNFVLGATGALATQIQNGAPFGLLLSADTTTPDKLFRDGLAVDPPRVYARGSLILLSADSRDFSKGLALLADAGVGQFAIANPKTAPYGQAAVEALSASGLWDRVKDKAVTGQSIAQALQFTLASTGLGFVNKSALYGKELAGVLAQRGSRWIDVDPALYAPLNQAFAVLKNPSDSGLAAAQAFAAFLLSPAGRAIFAANGYLAGN